MGDPRKLRKHYSGPTHPWQKERIDEEVALSKEYGFKNKVELWRLNSLLSKYKQRVKNLIPKKDAKSEEEKKGLLKRLYELKLVKQDAIPEDILGVTLRDFCERRLQTVVLRKGLARSIKQARQFIVHEHIFIGERKITSPSYITSSSEELMIRFDEKSPLSVEDHPERVQVAKQLKEEMAEAGLKPHVEGESKREAKHDAERPKRRKITPRKGPSKGEAKKPVKEEAE
ncbi:MAG: 30S ribosomal protein S4 [Nanoarchaeota archaeon]|nr:30S ribosomal protein S4 [Nanoarchaeota archaeon]